MTAPKALNAIYRDKECPPWPIEGEFSIYPRESLCRIIINKQGKICGKRISDSCAGSLRQHVKVAHLPDDTSGRQRHLQKLELNTGKLGPPGREIVAEVVKEFIRRYKNPTDLDTIHFDEDSSDDEQEEVEESVSSEEEDKNRSSLIDDHDQEDKGEDEDEDDEDSKSQGGMSENAITEDCSPPQDLLSEKGYESAPEESIKKEKETILEVRGERVKPSNLGEDDENCERAEYDRNGAEHVSQNEDKEEKKFERVESIQEDMSDASSEIGYGEFPQEEEDDQVFEEDVESWKEERTWEINKKRGEELMMWDNDEEQEVIAPLKQHHLNEYISSRHHEEKQREETLPKRQRPDEDESDKHNEDRKVLKDTTPSKRQRIDGNEGIKTQDDPVLPIESIIKKEESPEPSEVYYLASEGIASSTKGAYLDHEGDISMSGF